MPKGQMTAKVKQIADHFSTILSGANTNQSKFYRPVKKGPGDLEYTLALLVDKDDSILIADTPPNWEVADERVTVLGKLYLSLDSTSRKSLISMATDAVKRESPYSRYSAYLFTFLAKYLDLEMALQCVLDSFSLDEIGVNTLRAVSNFLKHDSGLVSEARLNRLSVDFSQKWETMKLLAVEQTSRARYTAASSQSIHESLQSTITRILKQVQEIKYQRLKEQLFNDPNLEINQDRQVLTVGLANFGFRKELVESLDHAESEYRKAESKFDFKTAVDHNRSFFEALLWETAVKVAKMRNQPLTARQKFPVEVGEYLRKTDFFTEKFHKLSEAFYHFASEQSTHQLASGREIARVVRNLNIELGLLIIKRLESFK
jgi:hypothetical protein